MARVPAFLVAALAHASPVQAVRLLAREVAVGDAVQVDTDSLPNGAFDFASFRPARAEQRQPDYNHPAWVSNCSEIYLDVGSNIGVQVRKLFEPAKYPAAKTLLNQFTKAFGEPSNRTKKVCALGMEPNPHQQPRLQALAANYTDRGFHAHFYPYAAWTEEGTMTFHTDMKDHGTQTDIANSQHEEWGAHLHKGREDVQVRTISLSNFIDSLPRGSVKLMKLDIEGAEYETLGQGIPHDMMCQDRVESVFFEAHRWGRTQTFWKGPRTALEITRRIKEHKCNTSVPTATLSLDDESYIHDVDSDFAR